MKLKQSFLFLSCLLLTSLIYAQSSTIKGRISVFDSKNEDGDIEYVENAQISSPYSKAVNSDYKGRFSLKMNGHQKGDPLNLLIKKEGYETVNQMEVDNAEPNNKYTLRIYLAQNGKMDEIRRRLLGNSSNYVADLKEEMLDSIAFNGPESQAAIANLEKRTGEKIYNVLEAEEAVEKMNNYIEEQLPDYIFSLAGINPDFASKMFKSAFAHYKEGNIDKAIKTIDESKLDKAISHIKNVIKESKNDPSKEYKLITLRMKTLNQIRDTYILKIIALQQSFQFVEANNALERLSNISKILPLPSDSKVIEKLKIPALSTMQNENKDLVLDDKKMTKEDEIAYEPSKTIFNEKENATAAEKNITSLSQLIKKDEKSSLGENKIFSEDNPKTIADAKVDDFENTLFIPEETSKQLITFLNREKSGGTGHSSEQPIMVSRGMVRSTPPPPPPVQRTIQRTPVVVTTPQPQIAVIDRNSYISVEDIVPMKTEVKSTKKKVRRYSSQTVTKRTSLRKSATASSKVLKRLAVGTKVQVIEQVDKYWCRVLLNGREGFVKAFLLE